MGPRSDNRGYAEEAVRRNEERAASMGPRSDNRGYDRGLARRVAGGRQLQWVHGRITVVMARVWKPCSGRELSPLFREVPAIACHRSTHQSPACLLLLLPIEFPARERCPRAKRWLNPSYQRAWSKSPCNS